MTDEADIETASVLVVDDEDFSRSLVSRVLNQIGIKAVTTVGDGTEALAALAEAGATYDLVISDIEMPEMDGYELVRKIRLGAVAAYKAVPILILTGKDTDKNVQRARFHKINGFIVKPPDPRDLERKIRRALASDR